MVGVGSDGVPTSFLSRTEKNFQFVSDMFYEWRCSLSCVSLMANSIDKSQVPFMEGTFYLWMYTDLIVALESDHCCSRGSFEGWCVEVEVCPRVCRNLFLDAVVEQSVLSSWVRSLPQTELQCLVLSTWC